MVVCQIAAVRLGSVGRIWRLVYLQVLVLYALFPGKVGVETATVDCLKLHPAVHCYHLPVASREKRSRYRQAGGKGGCVVISVAQGAESCSFSNGVTIFEWQGVQSWRRGISCGFMKVCGQVYEGVLFLDGVGSSGYYGTLNHIPSLAIAQQWHGYQIFGLNLIYPITQKTSPQEHYPNLRPFCRLKVSSPYYT